MVVNLENQSFVLIKLTLTDLLLSPAKATYSNRIINHEAIKPTVGNLAVN